VRNKLDENITVAAKAPLTAAGHQVDTVADEGLTGTPDPALLDVCRTNNDCSLEVQDVSQSCTNSGVTNNRLVLMNGDTQVPGDSGGGWSLGTKAYGSHKGQCKPDFPNRETFSVAALYDEALGVRVTCGC